MNTGSQCSKHSKHSICHIILHFYIIRRPVLIDLYVFSLSVSLIKHWNIILELSIYPQCDGLHFTDKARIYTILKEHLLTIIFCGFEYNISQLKPTSSIILGIMVIMP